MSAAKAAAKANGAAHHQKGQVSEVFWPAAGGIAGAGSA
jgi:hypothetical protein